MPGTGDIGECQSTTTVILRLWTPARSRVVAFRLFPESVIVRRQDRRHVMGGGGTTESAVLTWNALPGEIRRWLATTGLHPAGRTVLQTSVVDPDRTVWDWAEMWCRHRRGWYRIGYGDDEAVEAVVVDQEELGWQVSTALLRRIERICGVAAAGRE
jgi:GNAT superfamily N-acetyltransferase